jgi:hypothetical protein
MGAKWFTVSNKPNIDILKNVLEDESLTDLPFHAITVPWIAKIDDQNILLTFLKCFIEEEVKKSNYDQFFEKWWAKRLVELRVNSI